MITNILDIEDGRKKEMYQSKYQMRKGFSGIHHVRAGNSNPQTKIDFHISILEL
jgi:hypothetical protein